MPSTPPSARLTPFFLSSYRDLLLWTFQEWDRRGKPGTSFFAWLSTPGVQLAGCPRHELETDVVHYCPPEEVVNYALSLEVTHEVRTNTTGG